MMREVRQGRGTLLPDVTQQGASEPGTFPGSRLPDSVMSGCFLSPGILVEAQKGRQGEEDDFPQNKSRED